MTIEQARERDAKAKAAFFAGETGRHPHGQSGLWFLLPYEDDRRCFDGRYEFSEWGNAAGMV